MRTKFLLIVILITNFILAQTANFSIDNNVYSIEKIDSNYTISATWRLDHIQIIFKTPSKDKAGGFDNVTIETVGRDLKMYSIGQVAQKITDKTGAEDGTGTISANWFVGRDRKNITSLGQIENSTGNIKLLKVEENKVSGSFQANIDGKRILGNFENIEVKSW